jgi:hypothetical protein
MSLFEGVIITIFAELGPAPLANESPLDEAVAIKLSIAGMTILTMGYGGDGVFEKRHFRLHGPLPVPDSVEYEALAMSFKVEATVTDDERVREYGRECTLFLVFSTKKRTEVLNYHRAIEAEMKQFLQKFSTETQLSEPQVAGQINDKLRELTAVKSTTPYKAPQELDLFEEKTFALYTIDDQGELEELKSLNQAETVDVLIFVNTITKNIYKIIMHDNLSQRMLFLAGKAASQLNLNKFRSQCNVKDVSDMMMRNYLLDRITIIFKEYGMNSEANQ